MQARIRAIAVLTVALPLLGAFVLRAVETRWAADDYCLSALVKDMGFWQTQVYTYGAWSGRFVSRLIDATLIMLGQGFAPAFPVALVVAWGAAASLFVHRLFRQFRIHTTRLDEYAAAAAFVASCVHAGPDTFQTLLWTTGIAAYGIPAVLLTLLAAQFLGFAERETHTRRTSWLMGIEAFLLGGFAETSVLGALSLAFVLVFVRRVRPMALATLGGLLSGLAVVALAPGNEVRINYFTPLPFGSALVRSLEAVPSELLMLAAQSGGWILLLLIAFAAGSPCPAANWKQVRLASAGFVVLVMLAVAFAGYFALGVRPPARAHLVTFVAAALSAAVLAATWRGSWSRGHARWASAAALIVAVASGPVPALMATPEVIREAREFRKTADAIDDTAVRHRGEMLIVDAPRQYGLLDYIASDPKYWTNVCVANHYGLAGIRTPGR